MARRGAAYDVGESAERGGVDPPALPVQVHVVVGAAAEGDHPPGGDVRQQLGLGQHPPAEAEAHRFVEVGTGGDQVDRVRLGHAAGPEHVVLEPVLAVEHDDRHRLPVVATPPGPPCREPGRGRRPVAQEAEVLGAAAPDGMRVAGHRCQRLPAAQELARECLVLDHEPERQVVAAAYLGEHVPEPGGERVGVHRDRDLDAGRVVRESRPGLVVQEPGLPAEPDQRGAGLGRLARGAAADDDLADLALERADPLAHRAGRHVQGAGRRLERAVLGDRDQRVDGGGVVRHEGMLINRAKVALVFTSSGT